MSRVEIAEVVAPLLAHGPRTEVEILSFAVATATRPAVIEVLRQLRPGSYSEVRELWSRLPDTPIEA